MTPSDTGMERLRPSELRRLLMSWMASWRWKSMVVMSSQSASALCMAAIMAMKACVIAGSMDNCDSALVDSPLGM